MKKLYTILILCLLSVALYAQDGGSTLKLELEKTFQVQNDYQSTDLKNIYKEFIIYKDGDQGYVKLVGYIPSSTETFNFEGKQPKSLIRDIYGNDAMAIITKSSRSNKVTVFKVFVESDPVLIDLAQEGENGRLRFTAKQ
jgi:hypothetical protein